MDALRTGVLFVLLVPVSCEVNVFFTEPIICYCLDAFLIIYCIIATALFFKEKFSRRLPVAVPLNKQEGNGGIYQELERPKDADPYQMLEPTKKKKNAAKKKKPEANHAQQGDKDPYESLIPNSTAPAPSPH